MKHILRLAVTVLMCAMLCAAMTSCYEAPPTIIDPVDDTAATTTTTAPTEEQGPLTPTVSDVFILYSTELAWSDLEPFAHTKTGDNTAHFDLVDKYGEQCALDVVIDPESGLLTEANITYNELTQTLLTDEYADLAEILRAMSEARE